MDGDKLAAILLVGAKFGGSVAFALLMLYTFGFGALVTMGTGEPGDSMPLREIIMAGLATGAIGCLVGWFRHNRTS